MIISTVMAVFIIGVIYLTFAVARFGAVQKLSRGSKTRSFLISLGFNAVAFGILFLIFKMINAVVIFLHVIILFLLYGLVFRIIKAVRGKGYKHYLQGWFALSTAVVYLAVAYVLCNNVWQTDYTIKTDKQIGTLKVALIADSHMGTTFDAEGFSKHLDDIVEQSPDMLIIAGDFVDDSTDRENMIKACEMLGKVDLKYGVWFAYGNHDRGYYSAERRGYSPEELDAELKKNNVHVLVDEYELVDDRFYIVGRDDKSSRDRKELSDIVKKLDTDKYIIVIDHQPGDYDNEAQTDADLVLSGHTHGGQFFPVTYVGEWIGANDRTYGHEKRSGTDFIVTSGIADWAMSFKTGTKSEYVIINIEQE